eukprot:Ihof_evm4s6 gene=Ihof_evmTU4s6
MEEAEGTSKEEAKERNIPIITQTSSNGILTDDDDSEYTVDILPEVEGVLSKWTNYFGGWQERHCVLKDAFLSYYLAEDEMGDSCRGFMNIREATVQAHEYDDLRFDITLGGNVFYLRAPSKEDADLWLDALEQTKHILSENAPVGNLGTDDGNLPRLCSTSSLASVASLKVSRTLRDKFGEADIRKETMLIHIAKIKETIAILGNALPPVLHDQLLSSANGIETECQALVNAVEDCVDVTSTYEEEWALKVSIEREARKRLEQKLLAMKIHYQKSQQPQGDSKFGAGPDIEEGPHMLLAENEFYDALETSLDARDQYEQSLDRERECIEAIKANLAATHIDDRHGNGTTNMQVVTGGVNCQIKEARSGAYDKELDRKLAIALELAPVEGEVSDWENVDGPPHAELHRKDVLVGKDQISDHTRAQMTVQGVTAKELCWYFWSLETRREWEKLLQTYHVLEDLDNNTLVLNQLYARIWPAAQRDATFLSALRHINDDTSVVVNFSVKHEKDVSAPNMVRAECNIAMRCQTFIKESAADKPKDELEREDIYTCVLYSAEVNPGGWVPPSVVRTTAKREYPKFVFRIGKACR